MRSAGFSLRIQAWWAKLIHAQVEPEDVDLLLKTEITNQKGVGLSFASDSSYWTVT
jgi:hypothetical protein